MGIRSSQEAKAVFLEDYEIVLVRKLENITHLKHKTTQEEYLLREFNYGDKNDLNRSLPKLDQLKHELTKNEHLCTLQKYQILKEDQYCSSFYRVLALFKYPLKTLEDQINERNLHHRVFSQTQLWSILASCILGMSHLQKNNIQHRSLRSNNILLSLSGIIQISDPYIRGANTNIDTIITNDDTSHIYLSPQEISVIHSEASTYNSYKSDIWALGMIILETGLLESQDDCYRDKHSRIHWETLRYNINRFGQKYSEDLKNMVELMLNENPNERPDWVGLEEHVVKNDGKNKSISNEQSADNFFPHKQSSQKDSAGSRNIKNPELISNLYRSFSNQLRELQKQPQNTLQPIFPSSIQHSRPLKNIFPSSEYSIKTSIDQNVMTHLQEEQYNQNLSLSFMDNNQYSHIKPQNQSKQSSDNQEQYYVEEKFKMGSKYLGYKKNGMRHGNGRFYYQDGAMFDGEWYKNKMQGYGKLYYQSGKIAYEGYWEDDQFSGKGAVYNEIPDEMFEMFDYNDMEEVRGCWVKYEGQFQNDMKNGEGVLYLSNGERFEGEFIDDSIDGPGCFLRKNGQKIKGIWQNNLKIA